MSYADIKELLNDAKNLATGANDFQLKGKLLDIQDKVYELQEENRNLRLENEELKNKEITEGNLVYKNNAYYKIGDDKKAHCSKCFDLEKILITMNKNIELLSSTYTFVCPSCRNRFNSGIKHHQNTVI